MGGGTIGMLCTEAEGDMYEGLDMEDCDPKDSLACNGGSAVKPWAAGPLSSSKRENFLPLFRFRWLLLTHTTQATRPPHKMTAPPAIKATQRLGSIVATSVPFCAVEFKGTASERNCCVVIATPVVLKVKPTGVGTVVGTAAGAAGGATAAAGGGGNVGGSTATSGVGVVVMAVTK